MESPSTFGMSPSRSFTHVLVGVAVVPLFLLSACAGGDEAEETAPESGEEADGGNGQAEESSGADEDNAAGGDAGQQNAAEDGSEASSDPESIHVLVNRSNPLGDWEPDDLMVPAIPADRDGIEMREEAGEALEELFEAALQENPDLMLISGYRSYDYQVEVYSEAHARLGTEGADEYYARPGYSEHQSGLAADVASWAQPDCILRTCFAEAPEGQWLAENAHDYGFIIRYPEGAEGITGYQYEPWHLRYIGVEAATAVYESGLTLEEHWDQPAADSYAEDEPLPEQLN